MYTIITSEFTFRLGRQKTDGKWVTLPEIKLYFFSLSLALRRHRGRLQRVTEYIRALVAD